MFYVLESDKSFAEVIFDLEPVVQRLGFFVQHVTDFGDMLRRRHIEFDEDCQVIEIGNYRQFEKLLALDPRLSLALPWRITVFTENGATRLGILRPAPLLATMSGNPGLADLTREIEARLIQLIDEVR